MVFDPDQCSLAVADMNLSLPGAITMSRKHMLAAAIMIAGLLFAVQDVRAHCDSLDGPVAKAVQKALETGNVNPVLAYAPAQQKRKFARPSKSRA
jgi:hypothetical protein